MSAVYVSLKQFQVSDGKMHCFWISNNVYINAVLNIMEKIHVCTNVFIFPQLPNQNFNESVAPELCMSAVRALP